MLLGLIEQDVKLKKVSGQKGGEWHGPCPICGGNDRFRVQPKRGKRGRFKCRQCGVTGDPIDYLRIVRGLSFVDACIQLGIVPEKFSRKYDHGITDSWRHKSPQWDHSQVSPQTAAKTVRVFSNPHNPHKTSNLEAADPVEVATESTPVPVEVEPTTDHGEDATPAKVTPERPTTPEEGFCVVGQTYCPDFRYHRRFRVEKCLWKASDSAGINIGLLEGCPNIDIEGLRNEQKNDELVDKGISDSPILVAGMETPDNCVVDVCGQKVGRNGRSPEGLNRKKKTPGPSFETIITEMMMFGCTDCKDRHGQVCAGGPYPKLIGLLERCFKQDSRLKGEKGR